MLKIIAFKSLQSFGIMTKSAIKIYKAIVKIVILNGMKCNSSENF